MVRGQAGSDFWPKISRRRCYSKKSIRGFLRPVPAPGTLPVCPRPPLPCPTSELQPIGRTTCRALPGCGRARVLGLAPSHSPGGDRGADDAPSLCGFQPRDRRGPGVSPLGPLRDRRRTPDTFPAVALPEPLPCATSDGWLVGGRGFTNQSPEFVSTFAPMFGPRIPTCQRGDGRQAHLPGMPAACFVSAIPLLRAKSPERTGVKTCPKTCPWATRADPKPPPASQPEKENPSISWLTEGFWFASRLRRPTLYPS